MLEFYDAKKENGIWILYYKNDCTRVIDTWYDEETMKKVLDKKIFKKAQSYAVINAL
jgi:hypothetical protein